MKGVAAPVLDDYAAIRTRPLPPREPSSGIVNGQHGPPVTAPAPVRVIATPHAGITDSSAECARPAASTMAASTAPAPTTCLAGDARPAPFAKKPSQSRLAARTIRAPPASMASSPTTPSLTASPTNTSLQSSPDALAGINPASLAHATPLQLPECSLALPPPLPPSAMSEALQQAKSTSSLMRRLSGRATGATSRFIRRRQSAQNMPTRDPSAGPVIVRRRSGSKTGYDTELSPIDTNDAAAAAAAAVAATAATAATAAAAAATAEVDDASEPTVARSHAQSDPQSARSPAPNMRRRASEEEFQPPVIPQPLRGVTSLIKVTKRRRKNMNFLLDPLTSRVYWDSSHITSNSKRFSIDDIEHIHVRAQAKNYREECGVGEEYQPRWFTIVYRDSEQTKGRRDRFVHIIAPNNVLFDLWTWTLDSISRWRHQLMAATAGPFQDERALHHHWNDEMSRNERDKGRIEDWGLDLPTILRMCRNNQINCSQDVIKAHFAKADLRQCGKLNFNEFTCFSKSMKEREDIMDLFFTITRGRPEGLDEATFLAFLEQTQGIDVPSQPAFWQKCFARFADETGSMAYGGFSSFLSSSLNHVLDGPAPETKLDRPLNEYFVASSHNTYLVGRQIAGESSTEAYIRALQRGCRSLEIDCWDGSDGRPIVNHGRTFSSPVLFEDCIETIKTHAFNASPYPLILSLEVHCNPRQQDVMVDILERYIGDRLLRCAIHPGSRTLPSPEELRHRILIKVKASGGVVDVASVPEPPIPSRTHQRLRSASSPHTPTIPWDLIPSIEHVPRPVPSSPTLHSAKFNSKPSVYAVTVSSTSDDSDGPRSPQLSPRKTSRKHKSKIIPRLGSLGIYTQGLKFHDFGSEDSTAFGHIFSLSEAKFESLTKDRAQSLRLAEHNVSWLMRVYPAGRRIASTNFDPIAVWKKGVQMVALNWQTYDTGMQINEAMFANGADRSGYVLKPTDLRTPVPPPSEGLAALIPSRPSKVQKKLMRFSVDVISAQALPRGREAEIPNPYVLVEMFMADKRHLSNATGEGGWDVTRDKDKSAIPPHHTRRTHPVRRNGFNPRWGETFKLSVETKYPDLVFVRFSIYNSADGINPAEPGARPLCVFTARLSSLPRGYRHLPFNDPRSGDRFLISSLFVKIMKEEQVDVEREEPPPADKPAGLRRLGSVFKNKKNGDRKASKEEPKE